MRRMRDRLSYANVMATIAVFIALGGSAYAATQLGKNTVGTKQLKKNSVTAAKIKDAAITAGKIQDGAVSPGKLSGNAISTSNVTDKAITNGKLADGAVTDSKLASAAIGAGKLAPNSVTGAEVAPGSLSTADLAGADSTSSLHGDAGAIAAHSCFTAEIDIPGAEVGDALFLTFVGDTPAPAGLTFQLLKASSPGHGDLRFCNPTNAASPAFSNVGIRVIALR